MACLACLRACAIRQWSAADRMSRSAKTMSWLTEGSLKKAVCEASLWIPLISFAARASTAVILAPFWAGRRSSVPQVMHGAMRDGRTRSFIAALKHWLRSTGSVSERFQIGHHAQRKAATATAPLHVCMYDMVYMAVPTRTLTHMHLTTTPRTARTHLREWCSAGSNAGNSTHATPQPYAM